MGKYMLLYHGLSIFGPERNVKEDAARRKEQSDEILEAVYEVVVDRFKSRPIYSLERAKKK
jgi:hypothetical protein